MVRDVPGKRPDDRTQLGLERETRVSESPPVTKEVCVETRMDHKGKTRISRRILDTQVEGYNLREILYVS